METPAVSVVIPVWNSGQYFRECLDSVVEQTLRNIEILIVDDASTDGSGAVADEYAVRDNRITVLHQKESIGSGPARNAAMAIARGEYIAFMDSDDLYPSADVLEVLYNKAKQNKANICGGSLYKIDQEGNVIDKKVSDQFFCYDGWYFYKDYQYDGGFYRFLYCRDFLKNHNLVFTSHRRFQDAIFFVKTMNISEKFYALNKYSYAYRKNHKTIIWTYKKIHDHLKGINELLCFSSLNKLTKLHYLMAKNLLDTINYKMKFHIKILFLIDIIKILKCIDWSVMKKENDKNKVNVSLVKILYRYVF